MFTGPRGVRPWLAALASVLMPLSVAVPARAAAPAPNFSSATQTPVGGFPLDVAVGDFNGDGWSDAVTANWHDSSISVLTNNHNGGFTRHDIGPFPLLYVPSGTPLITSVAVGDVSGDGKADIVFAADQGEYVGVLLGNGDGTFQPLRTVNINPGGQAFPDAVAIGDMNGDGKADIVVVRNLNDSVQTLLGNGDGTFTRGATYATGGYGSDYVALADLNGDGHLDAVVANNNSNTVSVIFGDGSGGWTSRATYPVTGISGNNPNPGNNPLAIGDLNGDGHPDIVVPGNHVSGKATILYGDGTGTFTPSTLNLPPIYPWGVGIADFNGDGIPDLAFAGWGSQGVVLPGQAGGGFGSPVYTPQNDIALGLAVGDFNRDGRPDLLLTNFFSDHVSLLLNAPKPVDTTPPVITPVVTPPTPDGANGWYRGNVTLTWNVSEPESPSSLVQTGCAPQAITADQPMTTYTCTATSLGGTTGPVRVTIGRDATPPRLSGAVTPAAPNGNNGWYVTAPTVSWTCDDATSGVASCPSPTTLTADGANQSVTATATDRAGNSTSAMVGGISVDTTPPTITISGVQDGATYILGAVPTPTYTVTDAASGVASQTATLTKPTTASGAGTYVYAVTATDRAGNTVTATATYHVAYQWGGFLAPLPTDQPQSGNRTLPVKFTLSQDGAGGPVTDALAALYVNGHPAVAHGASQSGDQFSFVGDHYQYDLDLGAQRLGAGPVTLTVLLDDGTSHSTTITIK